MLALSIIAIIAILAAFLFQLKRGLMMLQQNSYRNERYLRWIRETGETTRMDRLIAFLIFFITLMPNVTLWLAMGLIALFGAGRIYSLCSAHYKKPLVATKRVWRIAITAIVIAVAAYAAPFFFLRPIGAEANLKMVACYLTLGYAVSYLLLLSANWVLKPVEKHINQGFYNDAKSILQAMPDLKIIGVTGSYGKTSTKHYLQRILSEAYEVTMTPGNFNTTLGVIRTIRENLKPYTQVFIVEMGAKQKGDIKEICDLVHPEIGIVTAVGPQHLESFGSIQNVQSTKFELVDSLPQSGLAVLNNGFEYIANRPVSNCRCMRYDTKPDKQLQFTASNIKYTPAGTSFTVEGPDGFKLDLNTQLVGNCNVSNLIAAVIVALELGVTQEQIKYAVERIEQVEHRLSLKRIPGGLTIIDDAYNSNPSGSKMALEVLGAMTPGTRFIITPGMIELGEKQFELNKEFGKNIAAHADVAIIVGEYNKEAILQGLQEGNMPAQAIHTVASFQEGHALMLRMSKPGDTVLFENDLPDTFK